MSIQVKRLKQTGSDFVPITLAEAVVVNCRDLPGLAKYDITTLERVLRAFLGIMGTNAQDIESLEKLISEINKVLEEKQDKLIPGNGIEILPNGVINATFSTTLYVVERTLPSPSVEYINKIYLIPEGNNDAPHRFNEFVCVQEEDTYYWEQLGSINSEIDLTDYISKAEFYQYIQKDSIQTVDITASDGSTLITLEYNIDEDFKTVFDHLVS